MKKSTLLSCFVFCATGFGSCVLSAAQTPTVQSAIQAAEKDAVARFVANMAVSQLSSAREVLDTYLFYATRAYPLVLDSVKEQAWAGHEICMYWYFRGKNPNSPHRPMEGPELRDLLAMVIISAVLTKASMDACTVIGHKEFYKALHKRDWTQKDNPLTQLIYNYWYRLSEEPISIFSRDLSGDVCSYAEVKARAWELWQQYKFDTDEKVAQLPPPVAVTTFSPTDSRAWVRSSTDVHVYNAPEDLVMPELYVEQLGARIAIERLASFEATWQVLKNTFSTWAEFFAWQPELKKMLLSATPAKVSAQFSQLMPGVGTQVEVSSGAPEVEAANTVVQGDKDNSASKSSSTSSSPSLPNALLLPNSGKQESEEDLVAELQTEQHLITPVPTAPADTQEPTLTNQDAQETVLQTQVQTEQPQNNIQQHQLVQQNAKVEAKRIEERDQELAELGSGLYVTNQPAQNALQLCQQLEKQINQITSTAGQQSTEPVQSAPQQTNSSAAQEVQVHPLSAPTLATITQEVVDVVAKTVQETLVLANNPSEASSPSSESLVQTSPAQVTVATASTSVEQKKSTTFADVVKNILN